MHRDYIEIQDRSVALAYLITSVGRRSRTNVYGGPKIPPSEIRRQMDGDKLAGPPFEIKAAKRKIVEDAIREVCSVRGYGLHALNVRTNHVHLVVSNSGRVERMMDSFKAYSTKALRTASLIGMEAKPWSRHGSTRYLWTETHIETAVEYVVNGQGGELPSFD